MSEKLDTIISLLSRIAIALEAGKVKRPVATAGKGPREIEYNATFGTLRLQNPVFAGMAREAAAAVCLEAGLNADAYAKQIATVKEIMEDFAPPQAEIESANAGADFDDDDL